VKPVILGCRDAVRLAVEHGLHVRPTTWPEGTWLTAAPRVDGGEALKFTRHRRPPHPKGPAEDPVLGPADILADWLVLDVDVQPPTPTEA
jgi:hypothetical protein